MQHFGTAIRPCWRSPAFKHRWFSVPPSLTRLAPSLKRLKLSRKLLERVAGVVERRWWDAGTSFDDAAVEAGGKALAEAGIEPGQVGLLINTSVTRRNLEPSVAAKVHHGLGLPSSAMNFDVANACLGFVNGMTLAANMIDPARSSTR